MKTINIIKYNSWRMFNDQALKSAGNKNVNSISYKIRKTHIIMKFKFICRFMSAIDLKPHS